MRRDSVISPNIYMGFQSTTCLALVQKRRSHQTTRHCSHSVPLHANTCVLPLYNNHVLKVKTDPNRKIEYIFKVNFKSQHLRCMNINIAILIFTCSICMPQPGIYTYIKETLLQVQMTLKVKAYFFKNDIS